MADDVHERLAELAGPPLVGEPRRDTSWRREDQSGSVTWRSEAGAVTLNRDPWRIEIRDAQGRLLTSTQTLNDLKSYSSPVPFSFVITTTPMRRCGMNDMCVLKPRKPPPWVRMVSVPSVAICHPNP